MCLKPCWVAASQGRICTARGKSRVRQCCENLRREAKHAISSPKLTNVWTRWQFKSVLRLMDYGTHLMFIYLFIIYFYTKGSTSRAKTNEKSPRITAPIWESIDGWPRERSISGVAFGLRKFSPHFTTRLLTLTVQPITTCTISTYLNLQPVPFQPISTYTISTYTIPTYLISTCTISTSLISTLYVQQKWTTLEGNAVLGDEMLRNEEV